MLTVVTRKKFRILPQDSQKKQQQKKTQKAQSKKLVSETFSERVPILKI
jgi:hypothetical protein